MENKKIATTDKSGRNKQQRSGGFALAAMLCAVVILFIIGAGILSVGLQKRGFAVRTSSDISARCAADAGITKAFFEMNEKLKAIPWDGSSLPEVTQETLPNTGATYSYEVSGDLDGGYSVKSSGKSGLQQKVITCSLELQGPFERAILARESLVLKSGTLDKGYNSDDTWDNDIDVKVGTKSTLPDSIVLNPGVDIDGDVVVGVGGKVETVVKDLGASSHRMYALTKEVVLPPVSAPELEDKGAGIEVQGTTLIIGPADTGQYGKIEVKKASNPGILEVNGGDVMLYVTGNISLGQDCEIIIKKDASLVLYVDGDMVMANSGGINNENNPTNFLLFGTGTQGQKLTLKAKSESFGAVYAPNAIVTIMADSDVYGAITAQSFEMKSGGNFYYDKALRKVYFDDEAVRFVIKDWREW
jgi:hypothetical protein